jgi:DNA-binding CsgD family transcriptional regulator
VAPSICSAAVAPLVPPDREVEVGAGLDAVDGAHVDGTDAGHLGAGGCALRLRRQRHQADAGNTGGHQGDGKGDGTQHGGPLEQQLKDGRSLGSRPPGGHRSSARRGVGAAPRHGACHTVAMPPARPSPRISAAATGWKDPGMDGDADADLLLRLYRDAMACPTPDFQDRAIRLLGRALRFESAIWGNGYLDEGRDAGRGLVPLQVHTHEIDPAGFEHWKSINRADKVIPLVLARPGHAHAFHAPTLFSGRQDAVMRDYARRFGRQSYLITAFGSTDSTLLEWCSLYRPDADDLFSDADRLRGETLAHHLRQALEVNTRLQGGTSLTAVRFDGDSPLHTALATRAGRLVSAQPGFQRACAGHWREFDGRHLPAAVVKTLLEGPGVIRLARFTLAGQAVGGMLWLRLQEAGTPSALPPRRLDIALLFADGRSTKEIAQTLGLAHATVRNQLVSAYRTLGVSTRAGLRASLRRQAGA